jgi:hypothetical protein
MYRDALLSLTRAAAAADHRITYRVPPATGDPSCGSCGMQVNTAVDRQTAGGYGRLSSCNRRPLPVESNVERIRSVKKASRENGGDGTERTVGTALDGSSSSGSTTSEDASQTARSLARPTVGRPTADLGTFAPPTDASAQAARSAFSIFCRNGAMLFHIAHRMAWLPEPAGPMSAARQPVSFAQRCGAGERDPPRIRPGIRYVQKYGRCC